MCHGPWDLFLPQQLLFWLEVFGAGFQAGFAPGVEVMK
jgi:hypothetical protein